MVIKQEIRCKKCGTFICYEEDLRFRVLIDDIRCPKCGNVAVAVNHVKYDSQSYTNIINSI